MEQIGIRDGSKAWGVFIPDLTNAFKMNVLGEKSGVDDYPHLIISPVLPVAWPALFRVKLKISDTCGALSKAAKAIERAKINILSTICTPTGHSHSVLSVFGEVPEMRRRIVDEFDEDIFQDPNSIYIPSKRNIVSSQFSRMMLEYTLAMRKIIKMADAKDNFLSDRHAERLPLIYNLRRKAYRDGDGEYTGSRKKIRAFIEQLDFLPTEFVDGFQEEMPHAVKCSWMQGMATFWLIGKNVGRKLGQNLRLPIEFKYNARANVLEFQGDAALNIIDVYNLRTLERPVNVLATTDERERYLRVMLLKEGNPKQHLKLNYEISYRSSSDNSSIGLIRRLTEAITENGANIRYLDDATTRRNLFNEEGYVYVLIDRMLNKSQIRDVEDSIKKFPMTSVGDNIVASITAGPVWNKKIFVSLRDCFKRKHFKVIEEITKYSLSRGYELIYGEGRFSDDVVKEYYDESVPKGIVRSIEGSSGVLQILSHENSGDIANDSKWLNYEVGVALAFKKPFRLCLSKSVKNNAKEDAGDSLVLKDREYTVFDEKAENDEIIIQLKSALQGLFKSITE